MVNGDALTGDGYRYRGRGLFNGTGKEFYTKMTKMSGHDFVKNPDDMANPKFAVLSACAEWNTTNLNALADTGNIKQITKIINGGYIGLESRLAYYAKAKKAFGLES